MSIRITAVRLSGGATHQHIVRLWWTEHPSGGSGDSTTAEIVAYVEKGNEAYVLDAYGNRVSVGVVRPTHGAKYLRTYADGVWTDNLLSLPRR